MAQCHTAAYKPAEVSSQNHSPTSLLGLPGFLNPPLLLCSTSASADSQSAACNAPHGALSTYVAVRAAFPIKATFGMPRPNSVLKKQRLGCTACGDRRHHSVNYFHCPHNPRHQQTPVVSFPVPFSYKFQLLKLSIEIQANILRLAGEAPGVVYRAILTSTELFAMTCDETVCRSIWRTMHSRMPNSTPASQFRADLEDRAARVAGGWRALCHEKRVFDSIFQPRVQLPRDAWYALSPSEEAGMCDAMLSLARHRPALSIVCLVDGSSSMNHCFKPVMGCIQRMLLRLLGAPHGCGIGHTISLFQFNHTVVKQESQGLAIPLHSAQMQLQLASWADISIIGGGTNFLHALDEAQNAFNAVPMENYKLLLLFTDGIADDWAIVVNRMREMEAAAPGSHFFILGVTDNTEKTCHGFNFPRIETLAALGATHSNRLIMLSKEDPQELHRLSQPAKAP